jgi:hypothetical protein
MASTSSWLFVVCVALTIPATPACTLDTFGASGAGPGPTASSSPTTVSAGNTAEATTPATTGVDASTTSDDASTASDAPSTTSVDPSTTTTTTGVASSTTTTTGDMTGVTTMTTTNETTGGPPPKDPQPVAGLYEACLDNIPCDPSTDGCFTVTDVNMIVTDGFCTLFCNSVVDCGTKPLCPAVQECLNIAVGQNVCALKCAGAKDCPTGMLCTDIVLPMGQGGTYCF